MPIAPESIDQSEAERLMTKLPELIETCSTHTQKAISEFHQINARWERLCALSGSREDHAKHFLTAIEAQVSHLQDLYGTLRDQAKSAMELDSERESLSRVHEVIVR